MQSLKTLFLSAVMAIAAMTHLPSFGQSTTDMTRGEVRKVDKDARKITIRHEEIKNLDMPPMTMVFTVKDKSLLNQAKAGDKVMFSVSREDGALVITRLQNAP